MTGEWLSTGEAADLLGVTRLELYRVIDGGEVPARRCGPVLEVFPRRTSGAGSRTPSDAILLAPD